MKEKNKEGGMVIVEATIVFPVMFLVIFLMIFAGNAYLQKCRVEAIVNELAISGAAYCADPSLDDVEAGHLPTLDSLDVYPYRYFDPNGVGDMEDTIQDKADKRIAKLSTGLFSGMKPANPIIDVKYNNGFIYSTFSIDVEYKIIMPVRLLGDTDNISMSISSHADMPVSDSTEFVRNVDMVEDYMEKYGVKEKIDQAKEKLSEAINKAKEWFGK